MGLDMYLYASRTAYKPWNGEPEGDIRSVLRTAADDVLPPDAGNIGHVTLRREVMYWRKANAIHAWFVALDGGRDECQEIYVTGNQLLELAELCEKVLATAEVTTTKQAGAVFEGGRMVEQEFDVRTITNPDEIAELLPSVGGFFFGSTEYSEWYLQDIERTAKGLRAILEHENATGCEYIYRASW